MDVPDQKGRFDILKVHAKNKKLAAEVELLEVALRTPGFSGADLANLLNEAAILTGRRSKQARRTASQNTKGPAGRRELPQRVARVRAMRCAARAAVCVAGAAGAGDVWCWWNVLDCLHERQALPGPAADAGRCLQAWQRRRPRGAACRSCAAGPPPRLCACTDRKPKAPARRAGDLEQGDR